MRCHPPHLSGVAPFSTPCGPPSAEAVPPPLPRTASNATATPATTPTSIVVLIIYSPPSAWHSWQGRPRPRLSGSWSPCRERFAHGEESVLPYLDPVVSPICDIDLALAVQGQRVWALEEHS